MFHENILAIAKANPPKNPSSPPKKGNLIAMNIVKTDFKISHKLKVI